MAVEARNVSMIFGSGAQAVQALDNISVDIRTNEFFTLLGPSGCGKTTLLRLIAGFEYPTSGEILLDGEDIAPSPPFKRPVNTVFQNYALFPHMTVSQNIAFGLEMLGRPKTEIDDHVEEMLRLVQMNELAGRQTDQISGGQQQRVALARALAPSPKVLLLDEPLSALDYKLRKEMQIELKRMQAKTGITFVFVTHDQEEALTMSDRIAVMSAGNILQVGTPREIYERPSNRFVANFIGETNFLDGTVEGIEGDTAKVRLDAGAVVSAGLPEGMARMGRVTVMVRPEHAVLQTSHIGLGNEIPGRDETALTGVLENIVYSGTDTHFHVRLTDEGAFVVRSQNDRGTDLDADTGQTVAIRLGDKSAQVLVD